ncbi:universal stress protein [Stygiolobus caldivivus]|uniref:Universal stress protein A n=1 Tax=Stygiolobus caldivivus TaxID=2824673 RepID=A0A8D5U9N6_9CREN|nr:universal stress protein [Stygiolobus caldivivus]BCU71286.1 universal stress protein A [Stygiolobus caldivivus]
MTEPTYTVSFWLRKIAVLVDGSENSFRALELALDFAMRYGSQITVIHACESCNEGEIGEKIKKRVNERADYELKILKYSSKDSSAANEILKHLSENTYDAIIMGARGLSINSELNVGSVAMSVALNTTTTVILVR